MSESQHQLQFKKTQQSYIWRLAEFRTLSLDGSTSLLIIINDAFLPLFGGQRSICRQCCLQADLSHTRLSISFGFVLISFRSSIINFCHVVFWPPRVLRASLFIFKQFIAIIAGVSAGRRFTWPYHTSLLYFITFDHLTCFVSLYTSSVVITLGHLMFSNFRSRFLWNESICFSAVFVSVHSALLYRNIDVVYALKHFSFVLRLILFDLYIVWFLLYELMASPFLLFMSSVVSRRLPSTLHILQLSSPYAYISYSSVFDQFTPSWYYRSCVGRSFFQLLTSYASIVTFIISSAY